eukprot:2245688-Rhodomonas_salina.3
MINPQSDHQIRIPLRGLASCSRNDRERTRSQWCRVHRVVNSAVNVASLWRKQDAGAFLRSLLRERGFTKLHRASRPSM